MRRDKHARKCTKKNKDRLVRIVYEYDVAYAVFADDPTGGIICRFYGWNRNRQVFFNLERNGYKLA